MDKITQNRNTNNLEGNKITKSLSFQKSPEMSRVDVIPNVEQKEKNSSVQKEKEKKYQRLKIRY